MEYIPNLTKRNFSVLNNLMNNHLSHSLKDVWSFDTTFAIISHITMFRNHVYM